MTLNEAIDKIERESLCILNNDMRYAIQELVYHAKKTCEKPSIESSVFSIKYFASGMDKWGWYKPARSTEHGEMDYIRDMPICDLIELAKSGFLKDGLFESIRSSKERKLDRTYVSSICHMLIDNGYVTREEIERSWCW